MNRIDERVLAWALTDSVSSCLNPVEHARLCMKIGAGEQDSAIRDVLSFYADTGAELPRALSAPTRAWIQGYAGSDSAPILERIYDQIDTAAGTSGERRSKSHADCSARRIIATRSGYAVRVRPTATPVTDASKRLDICGVTTSVEALVQAAIEARLVAHKSVEIAVHAARSADWSWDQISTAMGGTPDTEILRRMFDCGEPV